MSKNRMKRKGKTRRQRKQRAGGTRVMTARIYIDPQGQERVAIYSDFTEEQRMEYLRLLANDLLEYTQPINTFLLSFKAPPIDYTANEPDIYFNHMSRTPNGGMKEIDFPSRIPYHLERIVLPMDIFGERYFVYFSPA